MKQISKYWRLLLAGFIVIFSIDIPMVWAYTPPQFTPGMTGVNIAQFQSWMGDQAVVREHYYNVLRDTNLKLVRYNVNWAVDPVGNITDSSFTAVDAEISKATSRGLHVILSFFRDPSVRVQTVNLRKLWAQIAWHYAGTSASKLSFEIYNEPNYVSADDWNAIQNGVYEEIRNSTSTQNKNRWIILNPTYQQPQKSWDPIGNLQYVKLPTNAKNVALTFHYYQPAWFVNEGERSMRVPVQNLGWAPYGSCGWVGNVWPGTDRTGHDPVSRSAADIEKDFDAVATIMSKFNGVPVLVGEFGTLRGLDDCAKDESWKQSMKEIYGSQADDLINKVQSQTLPLNMNAMRVNWTSAVQKAAKNHNFAWAYFDLNSWGFGLVDEWKSHGGLVYAGGAAPQNKYNAYGWGILSALTDGWYPTNNGDVNGDGKFTSADSTMALSLSNLEGIKAQEIATSAQWAAMRNARLLRADVNRDGVVTPADAIALQYAQNKNMTTVTPDLLKIPPILVTVRDTVVPNVMAGVVTSQFLSTTTLLLEAHQTNNTTFRGWNDVCEKNSAVINQYLVGRTTTNPCIITNIQMPATSTIMATANFTWNVAAKNSPLQVMQNAVAAVAQGASDAWQGVVEHAMNVILWVFGL